MRPKSIGHINREFLKFLRNACTLFHPEYMPYVETVSVSQTFTNGVRTLSLDSEFPSEGQTWLGEMFDYYRALSDDGRRYYYTSYSVNIRE